MPYITPQQKLELSSVPYPDNPGELNYLVTEMIFTYWKDHRSYQGINDILGALEGAKLEFYRRIAAPYEDNKKELNGDVYT